MPDNNDWSWDKQYQYDREQWLLHDHEMANKHDALCKEVQVLQIRVAVMWWKVAALAAGAGIIGGFGGMLLAGLFKHLPTIIKALQSTSK